MQSHGGVISDNVCYDSEGNLVLIVNGDYYEGSKKGINASYSSFYGGKRTGAAVVSRQAYGYGSFEVEMTVPAFNGICTAMWLYNYFPSPDGGRDRNHEIDIEIHGTAVRDDGTLRNEGNLRSVLCTTWVTEADYTSRYVSAGGPLNDGEFHRFRFDWHPDRVEFYVDGVYLYASTTNIPDNKMYLNIGCWFPENWCGEPDFETDYVKVRRFVYRPFAEKASGLYAGDQSGSSAVNAGAVLPERNYFANGALSYDIALNDAFTVEGEYSWSMGELSFEGRAIQSADMDAGGLKYLFTCDLTEGVSVTVLYETLVGGRRVLASEEISGGSVLCPPEGTTRLTFVFEGKGSIRSLRLVLA